jgi:23S rRNA (guanosine2251-2'-O)-methyltransferase
MEAMADTKGTPKDSHYARLRRTHRDAKSGGEQPARSRTPAVPGSGAPEGRVHLYGLHTVRAALDNPRRKVRHLWATRNALDRLGVADLGALPFPAEMVEPKAIDRMAGGDAVHQGVLIEADPLKPKPLSALGDSRLVVVLDQVTDPHNVGAVMRSAVAFGADTLVTTARHSPAESGVLAKAASGALEQIDLIEVRNLAAALDTLHAAGFLSVGLDSQGAATLEEALTGERIALVLGAEGKGLRQKTRETVSAMARLDLPGAIRSLNVSNAAAVALYAARRAMPKP